MDTGRDATVLIEVSDAWSGRRKLMGFKEPPTPLQAARAAGVNIPPTLPDARLTSGSALRLHLHGPPETGPMSEDFVFALGGRLNINRASARDLMLLPGIGPVTAGRIIEKRRLSGPFSDLRGLDCVRGLGPSGIEKLAPLAAVR